MWELDHKKSWVLNNWCFWTMVLEKTLESPLDIKEIKTVNPKRNEPEYLLKGLMMKLKLQYFGHLMQRTDSLEKTLMLGKTEGRRRKGWQRMRWLDGIINLMDMNLSRLGELVTDRENWCAAVHGCKETDMIEQLNWTELMVHFETVLKILYTMWYLGQVSIISQEYSVIPTSFAHETMSPLLSCLCTFSKYKFSQPV